MARATSQTPREQAERLQRSRVTLYEYALLNAGARRKLQLLDSEQLALSFGMGEASGSVRALSGSVTVLHDLVYVS